MVFNGDANDMDLCSLADDLLGGTDDTDFPLRQKALYANWALREIFKAIYSVFGGWTFQDSNVSGEDTATTNLLNDGTQFYAFATVAWLSGVSYKDENGNYEKLTPITLEEIQEMGYAEQEFMDTPGRPQYYRPVKNGIKIYPAWDTSQAEISNGLIAHIGAQDINAFTPSSTSTSPGYDSLAGHETVAAGMAYRKAKIDTLDVAGALAEDWFSGLAAIKKHYKNKFMQYKPRIKKTGGGDFVGNFVS